MVGWRDLVASTVKMGEEGSKLKIICKMCGEVIIQSLNEVYKMYNSSSNFYFHFSYIEDHVMRHKIGLTPDVNGHMIYTRNGTALYVVISNANNVRVTFHWQNVCEIFPQFLFVGAGEKIIAETHDRLKKYIFPQQTHIKFAEYSSKIEEFFHEYEKEIIMWNYTCLYCDEEYEGGLPSVEMVLGHLAICEGIDPEYSFAAK